MIKNYYKILGINKTDSLREIKRVYRKLALKWHPDVNSEPNAHEMFILINEAYLILSDEEARIKYNKQYDLVYNIETADEMKEPSIVYSEDIFNNENIYPDSDLEDWTENARTQAEKYSRMPFNQFAKILGEILKETGIITFNAILFSISAIAGTSLLVSAFPYLEISMGGKITIFLLIITLLLIWGIDNKKSNPEND